MVTKTKPDKALSEHAAAIKSLDSYRAKFTADMDQAIAEVADAQRAFDEWDAPRRRLAEAQQRLANLTRIGTNDENRLEHFVVAAADPSLAKEIRRLELELMDIPNLFKSWAEPGVGRPPERCSNAAECNAYSASCRADIAELRAFQQLPHDAETAEEKIRELRRNRAPRPS